jgi:hypothetical protein
MIWFLIAPIALAALILSLLSMAFVGVAVWQAINCEFWRQRCQMPVRRPVRPFTACNAAWVRWKRERVGFWGWLWRQHVTLFCKLLPKTRNQILDPLPMDRYAELRNAEERETKRRWLLETRW